MWQCSLPASFAVSILRDNLSYHIVLFKQRHLTLGVTLSMWAHGCLAISEHNKWPQAIQWYLIVSNALTFVFISTSFMWSKCMHSSWAGDSHFVEKCKKWYHISEVSQHPSGIFMEVFVQLFSLDVNKHIPSKDSSDEKGQLLFLLIFPLWDFPKSLMIRLGNFCNSLRSWFL